MVTYFNRKDLVSFGTYLMSEKRKSAHEAAFKEAKENGLNPLPVSESLKIIKHADYENWVAEI